MGVEVARMVVKENGLMVYFETKQTAVVLLSF